MIFKKTQLVQILGCSQATEDKWIDAINAACTKFGINTKLRLAGFIAQVGHESGRLSAVTENLNYSAASLQKLWPSRFDAATAASCARQPEKIANVVYASRMGNGSTASGDGWKYRGRGLIQCTGKANYDKFSQACGVDALSNPDSLAEPTNAAMSAGWFWSANGLNGYADRQDILGMTKKINGGTNGLDDRTLLYKKALIVLSDETLPEDDKVAKEPPVVPPDTTAPMSEQKTPPAKNNAIVEPKSSSGDPSKYPWNFVTESRSGHYTEIDDSPGDERIKMAHRTGTYWEIGATGTITHKSVLDAYKLTKGDSYDYVGGNYTQQVSGQSFRQSSGDMIFKTGGQFFVNASTAQFNVGQLNVSGEVNAPSVHAATFGNMSGGGMAFGDMLAKEAIVAYDLKKGGAPMLGGAIGFSGSDSAGNPGSADALMTNKLSKQAPNGTPWVTNGIASVGAALAAAGAVAGAAAVVGDILKSNDADEKVSNAMNQAASDLDAKAVSEAAQTPVFLKHVTFDKPLLPSMSTSANVPDPTLYVNNLHTIVDAATGAGTLHISNGQEWIPVGADTAQQYVDQKLAGLQQNIDSVTAQTAQEIIDRAKAITDEATARGQAIADSSKQMQDYVDQTILQEAQDRGTAITAEAQVRQGADDALSQRITDFTSNFNDNLAGITLEQKTLSDAISAEATTREQLGSKVDDNIATVSTSLDTLTKADSALSQRIDDLTSSTNNNFATVTTNIKTLTDDQTALSQRVDGIVSQNGTDIQAAIDSEAQTRTTNDNALSTRIDDVSSRVDTNEAAVTTDIKTLTDNYGSLSTRVDSVSAVADGASTAAGNAQTDATNALNQLTNITSDNILSKSEKSAIMIEYSAITNDQAGLDAQADAFSVSRTSYDTAITNLSSYLTGLTPAYNDVTKDTPIDGPTFRSKFSAVYSAKQTLLNSIDTKAKSVADAAQSSANTANTAIGNISSDNVLSMGEKGALLTNYTAITNDQTALDNQADTFGVSRTSYDAAITALTTYLTGLTPAYNDLTKDTPIDGPTMRTKFANVYSAKQLLLNGIDAKAKALADTAQTTANAKATITMGTTAPTGPKIGDVWIDTSAGTSKPVNKTWSGSAWVESDWRIAQSASDITTEQKARADGDTANAQLITTVQSALNTGNYAPFEPYLSWDFNNTVDGWTFSGANTTNNASYLTLTSTGTDPQMISPTITNGFNGGIYDKVRARIKRVAGSGWDGKLYYTTGGHGMSASYYDQISDPGATNLSDWFTVEWDLSALTVGGTDWTANTITQIRLDLGATASDVFQVDWVSIGKRGVGVQYSAFASVQTSASTNADAIGNIKANYAVNVDANGHVAGIKLMSNGTTSDFTVTADKFNIIAPSGAVARMEITNQLLKVYDSNGILRVKLGIW